MRTILALCIPLALLAVVAGLSRGGDNVTPPEHQKKKAAQAAIIELSKNLDAPDVKERAAKIVREHESEDISSTFKTMMRGGMGVGDLTKQPYANGVQALINRWRHTPPTPEQLKQSQEEMLKVTNVLRAMSELAPHRAPKDAKPAVQKEWAAVAKEFRETALSLHNAVEKANPFAIKEAARKINGTCCHCHGLLE